jgi:hydrogenase maturation protease
MEAPSLCLPRGATPPRKKPVLVLGLGNDILSDDAVGLNVARELRRHLSGSDGIEVLETSEMGLSLLDYIVGFGDLILVDAVQTGQAPPGFAHEFDESQLKVLPFVSPHFFGVGEVLALGRQLGMRVPDRVKIFAIEAQDPFSVHVGLTPALRQALPAIALRVLDAARLLNRDRQGPCCDEPDLPAPAR